MGAGWYLVRNCVAGTVQYIMYIVHIHVGSGTV